MSAWRDIPGVTIADGQARLPHQPQVVVRLLKIACDRAFDGGIHMQDLVDRVVRETGEEAHRVEGLAGWLPISRVAVWDPDTGALLLNPATGVQDLAMRYAAWVGSQPVPPDCVPQVKDYARAVVEAATAESRRARVASTLGRPQRPQLTGAAAPELPAAPRSLAELEALFEEPPPDPSSAWVREVAPARAEAEPDTPLVPEALTERIRALLAALDLAFLERRRHTRAALLALLAGQHVLLLGPPGTAKSLLARALCRCFDSATYFEYLLSRFTHPDELFGPVSIPGLKDEDYRRLTEGFLPRAHVAFLDEIFKANSAILNSLLTLVNERVFHHGRHRDPVPLLGLIGASNELPEPEGGLAALWDRFLVRLPVPALADPDAFLSVATGTVREPPIAEALTQADLAQLREAAANVEVPDEVGRALVALWKRAQEAGWEVSDRRWRQAVHMLRVGAAADGRSKLVSLDLALLEPVLAPEPDREPEVREAILEQLGPGCAPEHDLRAQWTLLHTDRVAPAAPDLPYPDVGAEPPWPARIALRRVSVARFLALHREAVERLAEDRARLERLGARHLWLPTLPVRLLATHIEAARDLARILEVAESYRDALRNAHGLATALLASLPQGSPRVWGHDAVCLLALRENGLRVGLTLAGECVPFDQIADDRRARTGPLLQVASKDLLTWVAGDLPTSQLLRGLPGQGARSIATALESVRRQLGADPLPRPPALPPP